MKKLLFITFTICSVSYGAFAQKLLLDRVIATVGGEIILLSEVEEQFSYMKSQRAELGDEAKCMILDNLMLNSLLLNQSK